MADPIAPAVDPYTDVVSELRGPLTSIQAYLRTLISRDDELSPAARQTIHQVVLQQSLRLDSAIDDVLLYSRLLADQVPATIERHLLAPIIDEVRDALGEPDRVDVFVEPTLVVSADRRALAEAVRRLVRNGLVYGPRRESVSVHADVSDDAVEVVVSDKGRGIPAERHADSREAFRRAVGPDERRRDGLGLGLAVADRLARLSGAQLGLRNDEAGFSAVLRLPISV